MRCRFVDDDRDSLKHNQLYDVEFRNEGQAVFVEVNDVGGYVATVVFPTMNDFLSAFVFDGPQKKQRRTRKFTDYETTKFFSVGEAAEFLGVHTNTVKNYVKVGKLRVSHRLAPRGDARFARQDVVDLLAGMRGGEF